MIKYFALVILVLSTSIKTQAEVKSEFKGNIDAQVKGLQNSKTAKDLGQNWNSETMNLVYGNIDGKFMFRRSTLKLNWFFRYSESNLYKDDYVAPRFSNYPNNVVMRNMFKLRKIDRSDRAITESILSQFAYQWGDSDTKFTVGRMHIEYGEGYTFNPIDPFMLPAAFSTLQNIKQGNDGLKFFINSATDFRLHFYVLGDKQFTDYNSRITRTVMLRGDWDYSDQIHVNYILGEDQKRHKYGGEVRYSFHKGLVFGQAVRHSQRLDKEDASDKGLFHYLIGYEKDLTNALTSRLEFGKNDQDNTFIEASYQQSFLPKKNFIALINSYKFSDLVMFRVNTSLDPESGFSYIHTDINHRYDKALQFHVFFSAPMSRAKDEPQFAAQRVFAGEAGLGVRGLF
jgi:hypothetical protein